MASAYDQRSSRGADRATAAVYGAAAFVAGFGVTYLLKSDRLGQLLGNSSQFSGQGSTPETWQMVGWLYFAMHKVSTTVSVQATGAAGMGGSQPLDFTSTPIWDGYLLVVPPALLLVAGYVVARNARVASGEDGAKAGAAVALGYLPLAALAAFATKWSYTVSQFDQTASISVGPNLGEGILLAGLVYPVVVGGIGGFLAGSTESSGAGGGQQYGQQPPQQPRAGGRGGGRQQQGQRRGQRGQSRGEGGTRERSSGRRQTDTGRGQRSGGRGGDRDRSDSGGRDGTGNRGRDRDA